MQATGRKDTEAIRNLLSKDRFSFIGPIDRFNKAEDLIKALEKLGPMISGTEIRKTFSEANGGMLCLQPENEWSGA